MKLLLVNGSPRGEDGSTAMLLDAFARGARKVDGAEIETLVLRTSTRDPSNCSKFVAADAVILAYPLYTDAMPALTKQFVESLASLTGACAGKALGFVVQSGFPEACQSRAVERYNEKLARRLGCTYSGCAIRGNCNRLDEQPVFVTKRLFTSFEALGCRFVTERVLASEIVNRLARPERLGPGTRLFMRILDLTPLTTLQWDRALKRNGAYKDRDCRPY